MSRIQSEFFRVFCEEVFTPRGTVWQNRNASLDPSDAEIAEFGAFYDRKLVSPLSLPVLSDVQGRLVGAISDPRFTQRPEELQFAIVEREARNPKYET